MKIYIILNYSFIKNMQYVFTFENYFSYKKRNNLYIPIKYLIKLVVI